jgi:RNA polymerase primary sigma factor
MPITQQHVTTSTVCIKANPGAMNLDDNVRFYRYEIGQVELLSAEEVTRLAQRIEQGKVAKRQRGKQGQRFSYTYEADAEEAKRQLIEANLRLVLKLARRYKGFGVDIMDLVQEGNLGLMHAVEKFDYKKGYAFSTYATWWIRQYMTRALAEQANTIRVPLYKVEELKRLGRVRRRLQQEGHASGEAGEPTLEDLASQMEVSIQQVISLLSTKQETVSLDMPRQGGDSEVSLSDLLEDGPHDAPERVVATQTLQKHLRELLHDHLEPLERRVIELRFGLIDPVQEPTLTNLFMGDRAVSEGRELGLTPVGKVLGISHQAVSNIEMRALHKLLHHCEGLRAYLEP